MKKNPKTIQVEAMEIKAIETMENNNLAQILVEDNSNYVSVVHLHDLLKEGIF